MTTPTAQNPIPPTGPYDPIYGLQEKVASLLTPLFHDDNAGEHFGYQVSCRSLQAYLPESRADFLNAGRTIAFSLASMALLREAFNPAMHLEDKMRIAVQANALNRSADQAERSMIERRRYQRAFPTVPGPQEPEQPAETPAAEAIAPEPAPKPNPPRPDIKPPARIAAIHHGATIPPERSDCHITHAMTQAAGQDRPSPHRT